MGDIFVVEKPALSIW